MPASRPAARLLLLACVALAAAPALAQREAMDRAGLADARIAHLEALVQQMHREQYDNRIALEKLLAEQDAAKRLSGALEAQAREQARLLASAARPAPRLADYAALVLAAAAALLAFFAWRIQRQMASLAGALRAEGAEERRPRLRFGEAARAAQRQSGSKRRRA